MKKEGKEEEIRRHKVSLAEIHAHEARREGRPPTDLKTLVAVFEEVDPGGKEAYRNAVKYWLKGLRDEFEQLCKEGKLGEKMQSATALVPKFGAVNVRERVSSLLLGAMLFVCMTEHNRKELIEKGGWSEKDLE